MKHKTLSEAATLTKNLFGTTFEGDYGRDVAAGLKRDLAGEFYTGTKGKLRLCFEVDGKKFQEEMEDAKVGTTGCGNKRFQGRGFREREAVHILAKRLAKRAPVDIEGKLTLCFYSEEEK